jgi:hypothetical protein
MDFLCVRLKNVFWHCNTQRVTRLSITTVNKAQTIFSVGWKFEYNFLFVLAMNSKAGFSVPGSSASRS